MVRVEVAVVVRVEVGIWVVVAVVWVGVVVRIVMRPSPLDDVRAVYADAPTSTSTKTSGLYCPGARQARKGPFPSMTGDNFRA